MDSKLKVLFTTALILINIIGYAQIVNTPTELNNAITAATPGTTISLADGTWNNVFINIEKNGTSSEPITITALNSGSVLMTGNSRVRMEGAYLTISGLIFQDAANLIVNGDNIEPVIELDVCDHCKIINNKIDSYNGTEAQKSLKFKWIFIKGQHNEVAYNSFIGKYGVGSIINDNRTLGTPEYLKIHHNYFADRTPINGVNEDNDQDAIRIGVSTTSLSDSYSEVYDNYFYNFFGEIEIISNKSGKNKYYNNTFRNFSGCLTLRHGNDCEVYGNYFFAEDNYLTAGVRVIGEGHKIYNNYIEGINSRKEGGALSNATGGINISNGRLNSELNGYFQVKDAQIINNTFVNCDYGIRIGTNVGGDLDQEPVNLTLANNILSNTSETPIQISTTPTGAYVNEGNIPNLPSNALMDDGAFYRLEVGGAAIDGGVGNYSFLTHDILGGNRSTNFDAGAEEFGSNGSNLPYNESDIGVTIGFGADIITIPTLTAVPSSLNFSLDPGVQSFDIIANVNWEITEDIPWLSLDMNLGFGTTTVTATVVENTTGLDRTGNIYLSEVGGGSLADTLIVIQLNTFVPTEIPIIGTTSLGMQDKDGIEEINAYNDDLSNYWTGNPDTAAEVSITFDLECVRELTAIGIHFWKADERNTFFSIAVADDSLGSFTTVIDLDTSAIGDVGTEQLFDLHGVMARYVKFIGIGNSSSSNWTSIANVNIYGKLVDCNEVTSVINPSLMDQGVTLFPNPVKDGILNVSSERKVLGKIEIFNVEGKLMMAINGNGNFLKQINVDEWNKGIYFIWLENIGVGKFIFE